MKSKTKNIGLKIDDDLREKIQIKIDEMGFKGTSEFVRYAIQTVNTRLTLQSWIRRLQD